MRDEVRLLAANLSVGDTLRTVCPKCNGGSTREASLSILKDEDGVVYKCFRANCGLKGGFGSRTRRLVHTTLLEDEKKDKAAYALKMWEQAEEPHPESKDWLHRRFQYPVWETLGLRYHLHTGRFLTPLFNRGRFCGFTARRFYGGSSPKAITYRLLPDIPAVGFWGGHASHRPLLIVEDVYSAGAMFHLGCNVCALLGTDTSIDGWLDIAQFASRYTEGRAVMALDEDATAIALGHVLKRRNMFAEIRAYPLRGKDIKDQDPEWRNNLKKEIE